MDRSSKSDRIVGECFYVDVELNIHKVIKWVFLEVLSFSIVKYSIKEKNGPKKLKKITWYNLRARLVGPKDGSDIAFIG